MKEQYLLTLNRPRGVSVADMKTYIADAVRTWANGGDPNSPLFNFEKNVISVQRLTHQAKRVMNQGIPSEALEYERYVDRLRGTQVRLLTTLKDGIEKATDVCSHWDGGDLAATVRALSAWLENACMAVSVAEEIGEAGKLPIRITIHVEGGLVQDVTGIPAGYEVRVEDRDDDGDRSHPSWDAEKGCFVTVYGGEVA